MHILLHNIWYTSQTAVCMKRLPVKTNWSLRIVSFVRRVCNNIKRGLYTIFVEFKVENWRKGKKRRKNKTGKIFSIRVWTGEMTNPVYVVYYIAIAIPCNRNIRHISTEDRTGSFLFRINQYTTRFVLYFIILLYYDDVRYRRFVVTI